MMMTTPRYASMAADIIRHTELIGQYQALDKAQENRFTEVGGQKPGEGSM